MASKTRKVLIKDEYYRYTYQVDYNHGGHYAGGEVFLSYSSPAVGHALRGRLIDSRTSVRVVPPLPPVADIPALCQSLASASNARDLTLLKTTLRAPIVLEHGEVGTSVNEESIYTVSVSSGNRRTYQEIREQPLNEVLLLEHNALFCSFIETITTADTHDLAERKQTVLDTLPGCEGFWDERKITHIHFQLQRLKNYGEKVTAKQQDARGQIISDHAKVLITKLQDPKIQYSQALQQDFLTTLEARDHDLGAHRHPYRVIAGHITAIILSGFVLYLAAMGINKLVNNRYKFCTEPTAFSALQNIKRCAQEPPRNGNTPTSYLH